MRATPGLRPCKTFGALRATPRAQTMQTFVAQEPPPFGKLGWRRLGGHGPVGRDRVHYGVEVERRGVRVVVSDQTQGGVVVDSLDHRPRPVVIQVREGDPVLGPYRVPDDVLIDVVEFIPVLVLEVSPGLELRS